MYVRAFDRLEDMKDNDIITTQIIQRIHQKLFRTQKNLVRLEALLATTEKKFGSDTIEVLRLVVFLAELGKRNQSQTQKGVILFIRIIEGYTAILGENCPQANHAAKHLGTKCFFFLHLYYPFSFFLSFSLFLSLFFLSFSFSLFLFVSLSLSLSHSFSLSLSLFFLFSLFLSRSLLFISQNLSPSKFFILSLSIH
jgi:hypothetical protein